MTNLASVDRVNERPVIHSCPPGGLSFSYVYTRDEEQKDIAEINKARAGNGSLDCALYLLGRLKHVKADQKIGFTRDEAVGMEVRAHFEEMSRADSLWKLLRSCSRAFPSILPSHPEVRKIVSSNFFSDYKLDDKTRLNILNETVESVKRVFAERCFFIANSLIQNLKKDWEFKDCRSTYKVIEDVIDISGQGWASFKFSKAEALVLARKSALCQIGRNIEESKLTDDVRKLITVIATAKELGFAWSELGITPKEAFWMVVRSRINELEIPQLTEELLRIQDL